MKDRNDRRTVDMFAGESPGVELIIVEEEKQQSAFEKWAEGRFICTVDEVEFWGLIVEDEEAEAYSHPLFGGHFLLMEEEGRRII